MGKIQSHVKEQCDRLFTEDRKTELKRGLSFFSERACIFKEIALLSKGECQCAVDDMNTMLGKSCKPSDQRVMFHCKFEGGLQWKGKSRIFCFKVDSDNEDPVITRYMSLVQFWTLRSDILKRVGRKYGKDQEHEFQFVDSSGNVVGSEEVHPPIEGVQDDAVSQSEIFDRVDELSLEEIECCICMERKSDVSLVCAHSFCRYCIDSWQQHDQKTCPICRQTIADGDEYWEITDGPDKQEMHDYVVSLASGIPSLSS